VKFQRKRVAGWRIWILRKRKINEKNLRETSREFAMGNSRFKHSSLSLQATKPIFILTWSKVNELERGNCRTREILQYNCRVDLTCSLITHWTEIKILRNLNEFLGRLNAIVAHLFYIANLIGNNFSTTRKNPWYLILLLHSINLCVTLLFPKVFLLFIFFLFSNLVAFWRTPRCIALNCLNLTFVWAKKRNSCALHFENNRKKRKVHLLHDFLNLKQIISFYCISPKPIMTPDSIKFHPLKETHHTKWTVFSNIC
jgi:hypothetical protein